MHDSRAKKTPLYPLHQELNGKMIEYANWNLPVYYTSLVEEHHAVRQQAGIFDVSHMGEILIKGSDAEAFTNQLITNDVSKLQQNQIAYTLMCYENGGVVDDILVYKHTPSHFVFVVNAANIEKDLEWIFSKKGNYNIEVDNFSDETSQIALQGPKAQEILQQLTTFNLSSLDFFFFKNDVMIHNTNCLISRSGYTGEDGFEIYLKNENAETIFRKILEIGKTYGLQPAGLGCRDTLRFEATLPLYGNEISQDISPLEASLGIFVKLDKKSFIGKDALIQQKKNGLSRKLVGFEMLERAIPRHGYEIYSKDGTKKIGFVTTGYMSPTLNKTIGLALLETKYTELDTQIKVKVRNKFYDAKVISKKFYNKNYKKY